MKKQLITEQQIRQAAKGSRIIYIDKNAIVSPLARDTAKQLGVSLEFEQQEKNPDKRLEDIFPVKVVAIASDHGGFGMKEVLVKYLRELGYITHDLGPASDQPCDYPDYAFKVAEAVAGGKADRGVMIDSVGIGSAMAANRVKGVLAAKCNNAFEARSAREHNYANVLTIGAKIIGIEIAKEIVKVFLETPGGEERHQERVKKILNYK